MSATDSSEVRRDDDVADDPIAARASLPKELIEYIKRRQKQNAPLCPKCGRRKIEVSETGWCWPCTIDKRERELEWRRRWWRKNRGRDREA